MKADEQNYLVLLIRLYKVIEPLESMGFLSILFEQKRTRSGQNSQFINKLNLTRLKCDVDLA